MSDLTDLMSLISASLGTSLDEIYQQMLDCIIRVEDPKWS